MLLYIDINDLITGNGSHFFRVKAKVTFVYFRQISDEVCILLVNRELVMWDEPNVRLD